MAGTFTRLRDTVVGMLTLSHYQGMCTCIFITLVSSNAQVKIPGRTMAHIIANLISYKAVDALASQR